MEKYPYLKKKDDYTIFTTSDDMKNLKNVVKMKIDDEEVSVEFLKKILQDNRYYDNMNLVSFVQ